METDGRNSILTTLSSGIFFAVFLWAFFGVYTSIFHGTVPLIPWRTSHNLIFGLVWLFFVLPASLTQAMTVRNCFLAVANANHKLVSASGRWLLLPLAITNLTVQIYGVLLVALSWFPSRLPIPLLNVEGGVVTGLLAIVVAIGVLLSCNVALTRYMTWLFRDQSAEYARMVEKDHRA